jgi:hypothetical protein
VFHEETEKVKGFWGKGDLGRASDQAAFPTVQAKLPKLKKNILCQ